MKIDELFSRQEKISGTTTGKDLILTGDLWMHRMLNHFDSRNYFIKKVSAAKRVEAAQNDVADAVFISSLDFARIQKGWQVIPGLCLASAGQAPLALLTYTSANADLSSIVQTVSEPTIDAALRIILREKYEIDATFFAAGEHPDTGSACKLLIDADALRYAHKSEKYIDIAEEWFDLTGFPLVYGFWIVHETNPGFSAGLFEDAHRASFENIQAVFGDVGPESFRDFVVDKVCGKMLFRFDEKAKESLAELYEYAFMYGIIAYNPKFDFR